MERIKTVRFSGPLFCKTMIDTVENLLDSLLCQVKRPGRYVGHELNMIRKDWRNVPVRVALAFPDVYEIGMSHVGMQVLYHVCNQPSWLLAERVYSPWPDMEKQMRTREIPLFALESKRPVQQFDMLGITLQYEMHYTNILNLLDLSNIPLLSADRGDRDPLVIAGGPLAYNPEPLADYLDAVVLGDGEKVILEIAGLIRQAKREQWSRMERLRALGRLRGVYVPQFYTPEYGKDGAFKKMTPLDKDIPGFVEAAAVPELEESNYPDAPLVPLIEVAHDRFSMEIMRGCGRGCRFCNAGMIYRPVRSRGAETLAAHARRVIAGTGYDEIALVSLSSSDHPELLDLLTRLQKQFRDKNVSISFPSLRTETFTEEMADFAGSFRKSGLTLAPEAGSQRLRDVINKNNREEDLLNACRIAFERRWPRIKLYFMIGLPTETGEDVDAIAGLVSRVVRLSKKYGRKEIHVSISPFSPKPHTPFQWHAQDPPEILEQKIASLKEKIRWREVKLSWRDPYVSQLEAALGLGDRRLGSVIRSVWESGARFDGWSEQFQADLWKKAFSKNGLDPSIWTREKADSAPLAWQHLGKGFDARFFQKERERALKGEQTQDCYTGCHGCGLGDQPACRKAGRARLQASKKAEPAWTNTGKKPRIIGTVPVKRRIRFVFEKRDQVRYTSHLDTMRVFSRAMNRANIPVVMSQGFHAHPRISACPPLSLGYLSRAEYFDVELQQAMPYQFTETMNKNLPEGFKVIHAREIDINAPSLSKVINLAVYRITIHDEHLDEDYWSGVSEFLHNNSHMVERQKKMVDIRPFVRSMSCNGNEMELRIRLSNSGTARVEEVLQAIHPVYLPPLGCYTVCRTGLYIEKHGKLQSPIEVI
ncbi:TIGR03960 family B12-binding radical SAM protein [bacterium]|nr:TIGR03960 family B12-binding radical SAM protein [bacterium]